jgi:heat-inducible transcriptional repressor
MNLDPRKLKILEVLVNTYIATGEPVSSKSICDLLDFSISSATVRNELSELTELGLLDQPHTSAGRIPSHLGYRTYINKIVNKQ